VVLRSVPEPRPFPPHLRVVLELAAAVDVADGPAVELSELGRARLLELGARPEPSWQRRASAAAAHPFARPLTPAPASRRRSFVGGNVWDDRAEQDARDLVALLFVAARPMRRAVEAEGNC
jgi:hypothetical protein